MSSEASALWAKHSEMLHSGSNYKDYRRHLHSIDPPCIPFLGMHLTDLVMTAGANKTLQKV